MAERKRALLSVVIVLALVAVSWPLNVLDIRARAPFASVASAFDAPPGYPGYGWSRDGNVVDQSDLTTIAGPSHCHWETATMMFIAWPPGRGPARSPVSGCSFEIRMVSMPMGDTAVCWIAMPRFPQTPGRRVTGSVRSRST